MISLLDINTGDWIISIAAVFLILWRISYGYRKGVIEELFALISIGAVFAVIYYVMRAFQNVAAFNFGDFPKKILYIVIAIVCYKVVCAIEHAIRNVHNVPYIGFADRLLGGCMGFAEAYLIIIIIRMILKIDCLSILGKVISELLTLI